MDATQLLCTLVNVYALVLFARIILSWVTQVWSPPPSVTPLVRVIYDLTEPVMGFFRRFIPPIGGLDISPIFIFIIIGVVRGGLGCGGSFL